MYQELLLLNSFLGKREASAKALHFRLLYLASNEILWWSVATECAKILIDNGANFRVKNSNGESPFDMAESDSEIVVWLKKYIVENLKNNNNNNNSNKVPVTGP